MADGTHHTNSRLVAVYGSAGITPGSEDWQNAYDLGQRIAGAGYRLLCGGYGGVMEAASQGAADAGGRVVGAAVDLFESRGLRLNRWITETVRFPTLYERLLYLVQAPDALVALRGGIGTLSEIALAWSLLQVGELPARPFVLVGPLWRRVIDAFAEDAPITPHDLKRLAVVDTVANVIPALEAWWASPPVVPLRLGDNSASG